MTSNIFGEPNTGIHSYRIFGVAAVDLGMTILGAYLLSKYFHKPFINVLVILLLVAIAVHYLFTLHWIYVSSMYEM
jgi:hypothetical protein